MPEISISEEQHERLEQVRRDVEDAFVSAYGQTRLEDAVEYLLDTYTPPDSGAEGAETENSGVEDTGADDPGVDDAYERIATAAYPTLQHVASGVSEVPGSGLDADEMRGKLLAELGVEEFATRLDAAATDEDEPEREDDDQATETETETGTDEDETDDTTDPSDASLAGGGSGEGTTRIASGSPIAAANQLLRDHDDRWREGDGDAPYEVDLPDGTTASARTKDDVRQLLFRHY
jgi:hypothetical protein